MEEIWKPIYEYEGLYEISNLGRVKSLEKFRKNGKKEGNGYIQKEKILIPHKNKKTGYTYVSLRGKKSKYLSIHRIVANAFLDNPNNYPIINHKNEIKDDNRVENLEWCTYKYNNIYNNKSKKNCIAISQYDLEGNFIKDWESARQVYRQLKIQYKNICKCCKGKRKKAGGFIWKYKNK